MNVNRGKQFEEQIRKAIEEVPNTFVIRLIDPQNGFAGIRNICDFISYKYPCIYLIECKSCHGNTMPFANITENQWKGMLKYAELPGINAGVIVWFIDHDKTYWLDIRLLEKLRLLGYKSIRFDANWSDEENTEDFWDIIKGKKRKILFDYDMKEFFRNVTTETIRY